MQPVSEPPDDTRESASDKDDSIPDPTVGSMSGSLDDAVGLYRANPALLPEHALLGTLIHAPDGLNDMEKFLEWRDFSSHDLRAVFVTVRGLAHAGELTEVSTLGDRAAQRQACADNKQRIYTALSEQWFTRTPVADPRALVGQLANAAPAESVPFRGVYDPSAQMRLARDVLAGAIRRKVAGMGVLMERRDPLVRPLRTAGRQELAPLSLQSNVEAVQANLDRMTARWYHAIDRAGTDQIGWQAASTIAAAAAEARRPARPGLISAFRIRRAEKHLIHLAVHSGHNLDPALRPEHFSTPELANTWQMLMDMRSRGIPVNYVSLLYETNKDWALRPVLSDKDIFNMRHRPDERGNRIAGSLRTVVNATLARVTKDAGAAVTTAANNRAVPIEGLLDYADQRVHELKGRATTARAAHQTITEHHQAGRSTIR